MSNGFLLNTTDIFCSIEELRINDNFFKQFAVTSRLFART